MAKWKQQTRTQYDPQANKVTLRENLNFIEEIREMDTIKVATCKARGEGRYDSKLNPRSFQPNNLLELIKAKHEPLPNELSSSSSRPNASLFLMRQTRQGRMRASSKLFKCELIKLEQEKMSYLGLGVSPGTVPVYHGTKLKVLDSRVRISELVLRGVSLGLGVVAIVLVVTDSQVKEFFSFEKKAKFTDMKALVFLVVANGLTVGCSFIQGLRCVVTMVRGNVLFSKPLAWLIFSADQVVAYVTVAAVAAALESGVLGRTGQPELQWMKVCNMYGKFCNQMGEGIASAFVVSLSMVLLSCISAFTLFRLYGTNKNKYSTW
ncbi:hypothetical protein VNO78_22474 [Psophocarpus tetragonolobus]|uniref:CASP-like protein n=1 Tax=Psophocarpus tetragonolobus TaxID=3891 RepID=A0AAN9S4R1_PSOTE